MKVSPYPPRSLTEKCFLFFAVSALVWNVTPSEPFFEMSRRFRPGRKSFTGSISVANVTPFPPWAGKWRSLHFDRKGREDLFLGRAVSALFWKVASSPTWSRESRCLSLDPIILPGLGLKSCAVSALAWKFTSYPISLESCAVFVFTVKV